MPHVKSVTCNQCLSILLIQGLCGECSMCEKCCYCCDPDPDCDFLVDLQHNQDELAEAHEAYYKALTE